MNPYTLQCPHVLSCFHSLADYWLIQVSYKPVWLVLRLWPTAGKDAWQPSSSWRGGGAEGRLHDQTLPGEVSSGSNQLQEEGVCADTKSTSLLWWNNRGEWVCVSERKRGRGRRKHGMDEGERDTSTCKGLVNASSLGKALLLVWCCSSFLLM